MSNLPFAPLRPSCLCLAVVAALAFAAPAAATASGLATASLTTAESGPDAGIVDFDALVVTGVAPSAALTFVTDPRQPRQPVPAGDGADYLKTIPGFAVMRSGGTNGDPVLRGMFGSRLNLLAGDGALAGACPSRMDNAMSYISPETWDGLTVIKGPQTVLWGGGAAAGTVRFERDIPYFPEPGIQARGSVLGGSSGRNDQVFDFAAGNESAYGRLTANRTEADDYEDGDGHRVHSAWLKWNADAAIGWTPDADTVIEASVGRGDGEARYAGRGMDGSVFDRTSYGLRFERSNLTGTLTDVEANLYYNDIDHVMDNYTLRSPDPDSSMPMPMASNVAHRTTGGRMALTWHGDHWDLTGGLDARASRHAKRSAMGRGAYLAQPWEVDARFRQSGVFAELHWHISDQHHLIAGARADRVDAEDRRMHAGGGHGHGGAHDMPAANPTAGMKRSKTLPSAFVRYEQTLAGSGFSWYAGLGHTARMPDYWELFSPDRGPAGAANAFAGVDPERTTQLDLGLNWKSESVDAWASVYLGRMNDYILFNYGLLNYGLSDHGHGTTALNADANIRGGEAGIEWRPAENWKAGGSIAYAWGELASGGGPLPQMTPMESRFTVSYDNQRWSAGALLRIVAGQDRVSESLGNVVGRDLGPSPGFAVFSLNGGYRVNDRMQLTAGIDNLFDRAYSEHLNLAGNSAFGYPADPVRIGEPGRTAWVKLNMTY
ncbi:TonB-dependent copper receptor [Luteimonas sp. A478]